MDDNDNESYDDSDHESYYDNEEEASQKHIGSLAV
jgi:hypothetical protein